MAEAENKFQELNDDELDSVNGGLTQNRDTPIKCLDCGERIIVKRTTTFPSQCPICGSTELSLIDSLY